MRVNSIGYYSNINSGKINKKAQYQKSSFDTVSFGGENKEKASFLDKVFNIFKRNTTPLSQEEEKSENIKEFLGALDGEKKDFKKLAKIHRSLAKSMIDIGRLENFKLYTDFNKKRGEKLVFGKVDENTKMPESITLLELSSGMKTLREYNFYMGLDMFDVVDNTTSGYKIRMQILGNKVIHYTELNEATGLIRELAPTEDGFSYFEGTKDVKGDIKETFVECVLNYDPEKENIYKERNEDGSYSTYCYKSESDMWEEQ